MSRNRQSYEQTHLFAFGTSKRPQPITNRPLRPRYGRRDPKVDQLTQSTAVEMASIIARRAFTTTARRLEAAAEPELKKQGKKDPELIVRASH